MNFPFPTVIDSSMISTYKACPQKFFREYLEHWKPRNQSVHLHAGAAFARGLEETRNEYFVKGTDSETAIEAGVGALLEAYGNFECPEDSAKSATRMAGALEYYFTVAWPLASEPARPHEFPGGKLGIEFSFVQPFPFDHPETGEPLLYCGRADQIVDYMGGVWVEDDKTTSSLGASWVKSWDMRSQFTAYSWGLRESAGIPATGVLVRGVSILKTKYDHLPAMTYRPQYMVDEWIATTQRVLQRMVADWRDGLWIKILDDSCNDYGGCLFKQVCQSNEPQPWLETYYTKRRWNPITREEEEVA